MSVPSTSSNLSGTKANGETPSARTRAMEALRRPLTRNALIGVAGLAAILTVVAFANNRPLRVEGASVERDVPVRVFGLGTVEARVLSKIGFEVGATLVELECRSRRSRHQRAGAGAAQRRRAGGEGRQGPGRTRDRRSQHHNGRRPTSRRRRAVLAQKQEANRRKQALVGRDIVSQQVAEEAARDEARGQGRCGRCRERDRRAPKRNSPMPGHNFSSRRRCCGTGRWLRPTMPS